MEPSCSQSEASGVVDMAPSCSRSDLRPRRTPQTAEKKRKHRIERDGARRTAETVQTKRTQTEGQKIEQDVLLVQRLRLSRVATPR